MRVDGEGVKRSSLDVSPLFLLISGMKVLFSVLSSVRRATSSLNRRFLGSSWGLPERGFARRRGTNEDRGGVTTSIFSSSPPLARAPWRKFFLMIAGAQETTVG